MKKKPEKNWMLDSGFELRKADRATTWAVYEGGKAVSGWLELEKAQKFAQELRKSRNEQA